MWVKTEGKPPSPWCPLHKESCRPRSPSSAGAHGTHSEIQSVARSGRHRLASAVVQQLSTRLSWASSRQQPAPKGRAGQVAHSGLQAGRQAAACSRQSQVPTCGCCRQSMCRQRFCTNLVHLIGPADVANKRGQGAVQRVVPGLSRLH